MVCCEATTRGGGGGGGGVDEPCIFMNYITYREVSKFTIEFCGGGGGVPFCFNICREYRVESIFK